jgi:hypothetical protein
MTKELSKPIEEHTLEDVKQKRKRAMLKAIYEKGGALIEACNQAGISYQSHYNWLKDDPVYKYLFEVQKERSIDVYEMEARRRALEGTEEPVFHNGIEVGAKRKYSDHLLMFMMKKKDPTYRDIQPTTTAMQGNISIQLNVPRPESSPFRSLTQTEEVQMKTIEGEYKET